MKRGIILLLVPVLACAQDVSNPSPSNSLHYYKERYHDTTVHVATVKRPYSLELVIASPTGRGKKKLSVMVSAREEKEKKNVLVAVNGGFFDPATGEVIGTVVSGGEYIKRDPTPRAQLRIKENQLEFGYYSAADLSFPYLLTAGPYLLQDEKNIALQAADDEAFSDDFLAPHPRTAIGYHGETLFLVVSEGRRKNEKGLRLDELATFFLSHGCTDAINLDGGGSSTMILSGEFYGKTKTENVIQNSPTDGNERPIANGFIVIEKKERND